MSETVEFGELMQQVREGSDDAIRQLLSDYGDDVLRVIRRKLMKRLRTQYDSDDFYQAVWGSFFARRELLSQFDSPGQLVAFLRSMAGNKVVDEIRHRLRKKRNISREQRLDSEMQNNSDAIAQQPTPSEMAVAREQMDNLVGEQPSLYQRIVQLRVDGATYREIAEETGMHERSVRRVVRRLSRRVIEQQPVED